MLQKRFFQRVSLFLFGLICYICIYLLLQAREESIDFGKRARVYNVHFYPNKNYPISYLQYECVKSKLSGCGGLADRFKGMFSAYAWSLLTGRKFVIKFTHPCRLEKALVPNRVEWSFDLDSINIDTREDLYMYYDTNYMRQLESIDILNYTNAQLINVRSGLMFINSFSKNPKLAAKIASLGYAPSNFTMWRMFHTFYSDLFKLAPHLEARYNDFITSNRLNETPLICVQLRMGTPDDIEFTPRKHTLKFWKFIESTIIPLVIHEQTSKKNWKLYVTSDYDWVKDEAVDWFGRKQVVFYTDSGTHFEFDYKKFQNEHNSQNSDLAKFENLILDFHTMQRCDYAVVSHSGFGILGAMNRDEPDRNFWLYTDPESMKDNYWKRKNFRFVKMEPEFTNLIFL